MDQLDFNLLLRWFVGLGVDEPVWVPTVFTKTPHVAAKARHSAIDARTTRNAAYAVSRRKRKLIEEVPLAMTAYNLIRMPKLLGWSAA